MNKGKGLFIALFAVGGLALVAAVFGIMYSRANEAYKAAQQQERQEEIRVYTTVAEAEAEWIRDNQTSQGAILLYQEEKKVPESVNPYFACQAALGLLAYPTDENLEAVEKYLKWHTAEVLAHDGVISDYSYDDGELESTDEADSVDSYAAEYLLLLTEYAKATKADNGIEEIDGWYDAVVQIHSVLESVTEDDITYTDEELKLAYLMDNCEVYEACRAIAEELTDGTLADYDVDDEGKWYTSFSEDVREAASKAFYKKKNKSFSYAVFGDGKDTGEPDFEEFYPDCVAQLYPVFTGMTERDDAMDTLYNKVGESFDWQQGKTGGTFQWSVMSSIAISFSDRESADEYLKCYTDLVEESREYPMHTANAGWVMRTCGQISKQINDAPYEKLTFTEFIKGL